MSNVTYTFKNPTGRLIEDWIPRSIFFWVVGLLWLLMLILNLVVPRVLMRKIGWDFSS
jgi:hypothetical protein